MKLTEEVLKTFVVAKQFKENVELVNSLCYNDNGDLMIASCDDDQILIYDTITGVSKKSLHSKKYGCDLISFTHANFTAIHGSNKLDDTIRFLSLHDNKYIRYFPGHSKRVVSLCMSPVEDTFLSGSLDKTIRLWDLRSSSCQGIMQEVSSRPVASFDPDGLIFAAGLNCDSVKLFDLRSFDRGPFSTFRPLGDQVDSTAEWTRIKFSPNGQCILVSTTKNILYLIDSFNGDLLKTFTGHENSKGVNLEASFTPDSQFVFCGSTNGNLHFWSVDTGNEVAVFETPHKRTIQCCLFNPKYMTFCTTCVQLNLWIPNVDD